MIDFNHKPCNDTLKLMMVSGRQAVRTGNCAEAPSHRNHRPTIKVLGCIVLEYSVSLENELVRAARKVQRTVAMSSPYKDNPEDGAVIPTTNSINEDDNSTMPARLRHPQKMQVETAEDHQAHAFSSAGMEMMPLAQNDMEYFDDEPKDDPSALYIRDEEPVVRSENIPDWLEDFLFPPSLPRKCQLLRPENIAVPACYLLVGLLLGLSSPLINAYPLDLAATEAQQTSISAIRSLPASFKLLFGFLSDSTPLFGYRRKSYMLVGWIVCSASYFSLLFFSNLGMELGATGCNAKNQMDEQRSIPPDDAPTMAFLSLCVLSAGMGLWFSDVSKFKVFISCCSYTDCMSTCRTASCACKWLCRALLFCLYGCC